jgi:hypothetical protein
VDGESWRTDINWFLIRVYAGPQKNNAKCPSEKSKRAQAVSMTKQNLYEIGQYFNEACDISFFRITRFIVERRIFMAYDGEFLNQCGALNIDCSTVAVVAVSGAAPNVCGHLLSATGNPGNALYFHVALIRDYPKYMTEAGYQRYLKENKKTELRRRMLTLPDPQGAQLYLEHLMANTWTWGVLPNNCVALVEEVIQAGGGEWSSYSNCPSVATADTVGTRINRFLNQMEFEIYQMYRLAR